MSCSPEPGTHHTFTHVHVLWQTGPGVVAARERCSSGAWRLVAGHCSQMTFTPGSPATGMQRSLHLCGTAGTKQPPGPERLVERAGKDARFTPAGLVLGSGRRGPSTNHVSRQRPDTRIGRVACTSRRFLAVGRAGACRLQGLGRCRVSRGRSATTILFGRLRTGGGHNSSLSTARLRMSRPRSA